MTKLFRCFAIILAITPLTFGTHLHAVELHGLGQFRVETPDLYLVQNKKRPKNTVQIIDTKTIFDPRVVWVELAAIDGKGFIRLRTKVNPFSKKLIFNSPAGRHTYSFIFTRANITNWIGRGRITATVRAGKSYQLVAERHGKRDAKIWLVDYDTRRKVAGPVIYKGCAGLRPVFMLCEERLN